MAVITGIADRRNPRDASKKVFAPRFGFAFRQFNDEKTVVQGRLRRIF